MVDITTAEVRTYITQRQAETTTVRSAYDLTRKDGSVIRVPEHERTLGGASNGSINRDLTILKRVFNRPFSQQSCSTNRISPC